LTITPTAEGSAGWVALFPGTHTTYDSLGQSYTSWNPVTVSSGNDVTPTPTVEPTPTPPFPDVYLYAIAGIVVALVVVIAVVMLLKRKK